jgi:hypothetical protein
MLLAHPDNPNRPPDWRWQYARWLGEHKKHARIDRDDKYVCVIRRFMAAQAKCKSEDEYELLAFKFPGLFWAEQIREMKNRDTRWAIEARLLADEPLEDIALKTRTSVDTIKWYELAFFNVLPYLRCKDYIVLNVLGRSIHAGLYERDYDLLWKLLGYTYGPIFLDYILSTADNPQKVISADMNKAAGDDYIKAGLRRKAIYSAATIPVTCNQNNILELYNRQVEIERQSGGSSEAQATMINNIQASITALGTQFKIGADQSVAGPLLKYYDEKGAELRSDEMLAVTFGQEKPEFKEATDIKFPEATNGPENAQGNRG